MRNNINSTEKVGKHENRDGENLLKKEKNNHPVCKHGVKMCFILPETRRQKSEKFFYFLPSRQFREKKITSFTT